MPRCALCSMRHATRNIQLRSVSADAPLANLLSRSIHAALLHDSRIDTRIAPRATAMDLPRRRDTRAARNRINVISKKKKKQQKDEEKRKRNRVSSLRVEAVAQSRAAEVEEQRRGDGGTMAGTHEAAAVYKSALRIFRHFLLLTRYNLN